jgi:hypothetical protein
VAVEESPALTLASTFDTKWEALNDNPSVLLIGKSTVDSHEQHFKFIYLAAHLDALEIATLFCTIPISTVSPSLRTLQL